MSRELEALQVLARDERRRAWHHTCKLPARVGATASAFAREHPVLAASGAASLAMTLITRNRRKHGLAGSGSSWPMAVAAVASKFLPDILRALGLVLPLDDDSEDGARAKNGSAGIPPESIHPLDPLAVPGL